MDRWTQGLVSLRGGLNSSSSPIDQGITNSGSARVLLNYEPRVGSGYRRIDGYSKFSSTVLPGTGVVLGTHPFLSGVVACRLDGSSNDIHYSTGGSWTKINSASRGGAVLKTRAVNYEVAHPAIVIVDGVNHALRYTNGTDTLINHADAPSDPKYVGYHLDRLVLAGYSANPSAITLSVPNDVTSYGAGSGAIELQVGDIVTGIKSFRNELYIVGKRSIHKLVGTSSANFVVEPVATNIGIIDADTLQEVGGDLIYLSRDGFRTIAGTEKIGDVELGLVSRAINSEVDAMLNSSVVSYSSVTIPDKSQYRLFYHRASDTDQSGKGFIGVYKPTDANVYEWSTTLGFPVYCAGSEVLQNGTTLQVFGHPSDGFVYKFDTSNLLGTNPIPYVYRSPPLTFPEDQVDPRKVLYKWGTILRVEGSLAVNQRLILDEFEIPKRNQPGYKISTIESLGSAWDSVNWDEFVWASEEDLKVLRINVEGSGKTFTLEISGSSNNEESHTIYSHILEYSVKGKR